MSVAPVSAGGGARSVSAAGTELATIASESIGGGAATTGARFGAFFAGFFAFFAFAFAFAATFFAGFFAFAFAAPFFALVAFFFLARAQTLLEVRLVGERFAAVAASSSVLAFLCARSVHRARRRIGGRMGWMPRAAAAS